MKINGSLKHDRSHNSENQITFYFPCIHNIFCHQSDLISYIELLESDEQQLRLLLCFSPHLQQ